VPACYPTDPGARAQVLRALSPVTFYETRALALTPSHLRWDEAVALTGGAPYEQVAAAVTGAGRRAVLDLVASRFRGRRDYLFRGDMAGKAGLEVLWLKLGLVRQLCRAVATVHRHTRSPHLSISPDRVMVRLEDRRDLPTLWRMSVTLVGLGNAAPRPLPAGTAADLPVRPYDRPRLVNPLFAAPPLRQAVLPEQPGAVTVRAVTPAGGARVTLVLELGASVDLSALGENDVVQVGVMQGRPPLALSLVASPVGMAGSALRLRSVPVTLDADDRRTVEQLVGQTLPRARFTVHPCLHVPCDVHALGMMLLTTVLANARRPAAEVAAAVETVGQRLALFARERPNASEPLLAEHAAGLLLGDGADGFFARRHVFADPTGHPESAEAIPAALWAETLLTALRAVTTIPPFSICRGWSDFDPAHPEVKVEFLLQLVETLIARVEAALFGLPGRRRELRAAIARVRGQLNLEGSGKVE
jgi:hypothetical protein